MSLTCYMCSKLCESPQMLLSHYRLSHAIHYVGTTVRCGQDGCPRTFESFKYLKLHLEKQHFSLINDFDNEFECGSDTKRMKLAEVIDSTDYNADLLDIEQDECQDIDLTESFMQLIGQLECKSNITHANIQVVVDNIQGFLQDVARYCACKIKNLLLAVDVSPNCSAAENCLKDIGDLPNFFAAD